MDKKRATSIIIQAANLYHNNLEDKKVLFVYSVPADINKQISDGCKKICGMSFYETAFHRSNFLHLTGVKVNSESIDSSINFYQKCIDGRLSDNDYELSKDGSTEQKLSVLADMMRIRNTAAMIGEFTDYGPRLYTEKVAGNVFACIGFVKDKYTGYNVPNTLLKKDIRDVSSKPQNKIYAILSKEYNQDKYSVIDKCDKRIDLLMIEGIEEYYTH